MSAQEPAIGRIVHYRARGSADGKFPPVCRAAIVTDVHDLFTVSLAVINPSGIFFDTHLCESPTEFVPGSWHWHDVCPDGSR